MFRLRWEEAIEDCQRARVLDSQGADRYKQIQQKARAAAESAAKVAFENAETMAVRLIKEEEAEKQRQEEIKNRKKKKKDKKKNKKKGVFNSFLFKVSHE